MKILVIKIAALGDIVSSLQLVTALKSKYPTAKLTWIVGQSCVALLKELQVADEMVVVDDKQLLTGSIFDKVKVTLGLIWRLKFRSFDLAFNLHLDRRYWLFLSTAFTKTRHQYRTVSAKSLSEAFLFMAENERGPLEYKFPQPLLERKVSRSTVIGLTPGGAKNVARDDLLRRWPIENYQNLVSLLTTAGYSVVILGAKSDDWIVPYFKNMPVTLEVGTMSLPEFLDRLASLRVLITHDSGPLHLASLVGTPVIAAFGPTAAANVFPRRNSGAGVELSPKLPCQPCYDGLSYASCAKNLCLSRLDAQMVFKAFKDLDSRL